MFIPGSGVRIREQDKLGNAYEKKEIASIMEHQTLGASQVMQTFEICKRVKAKQLT
jgi:hypothetical protein